MKSFNIALDFRRFKENGKFLGNERVRNISVLVVGGGAGGPAIDKTSWRKKISY